jgi:outer membrane murein-binding lipoprotein Lpp
MKYILLALAAVFIVSGCSSKKINDNVDSITSDVSKVFDDATQERK